MSSSFSFAACMLSSSCSARVRLQISLIRAQSPAAKGRVEREHATMQDRLVKELRLAGIDSMESANAFAPHFVADYNQRLGRPARLEHDAHGPLLETENPHEIFCSWKNTWFNRT
jgi:hypothetical protein